MLRICDPRVVNKLCNLTTYWDTEKLRTRPTSSSTPRQRTINVQSCSTYFWFPTSLGLFFETPDVTAGPDDVRDALFCSLDDKWGWLTEDDILFSVEFIFIEFDDVTRFEVDDELILCSVIVVVEVRWLLRIVAPGFFDETSFGEIFFDETSVGEIFFGEMTSPPEKGAVEVLGRTLSSDAETRTT